MHLLRVIVMTLISMVGKAKLEDRIYSVKIKGMNKHAVRDSNLSIPGSVAKEEYNRVSRVCYGRAQELHGISQQNSREFHEDFAQCRKQLLKARIQKETLLRKNFQQKGLDRRIPYRGNLDRRIPYRGNLDRRIPYRGNYIRNLHLGGPLLPYRKEYGNITVNPHNFSFILQPESCYENNTVLITVHSATQNFPRRMVLRNTWANPQMLRKYLPNGHHVKLIFILGLPNDTDNQMLINYEEEMYKDILQVDFLDSYHNNTYKAIYNMKWISGYSGCSKAELIIKSDDDVMVHLGKFRRLWREFTGKLETSLNSQTLFMAGNAFKGEPHRNPQSKWYIPRSVYKYDTFPYWFQGMIYFLSPRLARKIYELSFTTPYMFTDDVYVGIAADRVDNLTRYNMGRYYCSDSASSFDQNRRWQFGGTKVFYHSPSVSHMYTLWGFFCSFEICEHDTTNEAGVLNWYQPLFSLL